MAALGNEDGRFTFIRQMHEKQWAVCHKQPLIYKTSLMRSRSLEGCAGRAVSARQPTPLANNALKPARLS